LIDATALDDPSGNSYAGISSTTVLSFTTSIQLISKAESIEPDSKGGCIENTYEFTYDTSGNVIGQMHKSYDGNCELAIVKIFTYDISGNTIKYDSRSILGDTNYIYEYQYNAHNHLIKKTIDNDANGTVDTTKTLTNTYSSSGNRLTESIDYTTDGIVDIVTTWTYSEDGTGNPLTKLSDSDIISYEYVYDSNKNKLVEYQTFEGDSSRSRKYVWEYDENDNIIYEYSTDGNGINAWIYSNYIWAKKDVKSDFTLAKSTDNNGDGVIDRQFTVTTRDDDNNVTEGRYEESGTLDETIKIYWSDYTIE
jgi:hypothetical protein